MLREIEYVPDTIRFPQVSDMTMDGSPIIDRLRYDNVFVNAGWCYGGFKTIPASGAACARFVATGHMLDERGGGPFPVRL